MLKELTPHNSLGLQEGNSLGLQEDVGGIMGVADTEDDASSSAAPATASGATAPSASPAAHGGLGVLLQRLDREAANGTRTGWSRRHRARVTRSAAPAPAPAAPALPPSPPPRRVVVRSRADCAMAKGTQAVAERNEKAKAKSRVIALYSATRRETIGRAAWLRMRNVAPDQFYNGQQFHFTPRTRHQVDGLPGTSAPRHSTSSARPGRK